MTVAIHLKSSLPHEDDSLAGQNQYFLQLTNRVKLQYHSKLAFV